MKTLHTCIDHSGRWPPPACTWYVCLCLIWSRWPSTSGASGLIKYQASGMIAHQDQDQDNQGPAHGNVPNKNNWQMIWNPKPRTKKIKVRSESVILMLISLQKNWLKLLVFPNMILIYQPFHLIFCLWVIRQRGWRGSGNLTRQRHLILAMNPPACSFKPTASFSNLWTWTLLSWHLDPANTCLLPRLLHQERNLRTDLHELLKQKQFHSWGWKKWFEILMVSHCC